MGFKISSAWEVNQLWINLVSEISNRLITRFLFCWWCFGWSGGLFNVVIRGSVCHFCEEDNFGESDKGTYSIGHVLNWTLLIAIIHHRHWSKITSASQIVNGSLTTARSSDLDGEQHHLWYPGGIRDSSRCLQPLRFPRSHHCSLSGASPLCPTRWWTSRGGWAPPIPPPTLTLVWNIFDSKLSREIK